VVILNERLTWNAYAGCGLILLGVIIVNGVFRELPWRRGIGDWELEIGD
jgi:drug/metabolite transporter (DMT)-like permease